MMTDREAWDLDKKELSQEIARLHLLLAQNGIKSMVRLPFWLMGDPTVMQYFNLSDVVEKENREEEIKKMFSLGPFRSN